MKGEVLSAAEEGRMAENAFGVVCAGLMEAIHVELSYEAVDFIVAEVSREDDLLELVDVFDDELATGGSPVDDLAELFLVLTRIDLTFRISKVLAMKPAISLLSVS
jgi:hypothetical protein